jgi:hypothetical protein
MATAATFTGSNHGWDNWGRGQVSVSPAESSIAVQIGPSDAHAEGGVAETVHLTGEEARQLASSLHLMANAGQAGNMLWRKFPRFGSADPSRSVVRALEISMAGGGFTPDGQITVRLRIGDPATMDRAALASTDLPMVEVQRLASHLDSLVRTLGRGDVGLGAA